MDARLVGWARTVKARDRRRAKTLPVLWLFTDLRRLPDPVPAIRRLPHGLAGVVLRDDRHPDRLAYGRRIAEACRERRAALAVAGDWRLAARLRAGLHLRSGCRPGTAPRHLRAWTSSAHGPAHLIRARRAGVALAFLSPAFATVSHPGATPLGPLRWALAARRGGGAAALGGVTGATIVRLPRPLCRGAGAIGSLT